MTEATIWPEDGMRARIAELEAENERLVERLQDDFDEHCAAWTRRAEKAEAEYAACASDLVAQQALTIEQSKLREQAEAELAALQDAWSGLRSEVMAYEKSGIDLYQRENGKAFRKMMDRWQERGK